MESTERSQVRLILEHERLAVQRSCQEKLKALYADHSAKGCLQSGATAKAGIRIIDDLAEEFVDSAVDQVSAVAMDMEAFALIVAEMEGLFRVFRDEVDGLTNMTTGNKAHDPGSRSIVDAIEKLLSDALSRATRQLDIHRFTFTKPSPQTLHSMGIRRNEAAGAAPIDAKPARAQVGRLPADWWDDLWIEIFRQVYLGELKPKSQADIVRAMQQWLSDSDIEAADSTLKPRARKLLQMLQATDG